jgi:succinate dehydrogenase / fumarate reductase iron-sulfur subunit
MAEPSRSIRFRVWRQDSPSAPPYWEHFEVPYRPGSNVLACLMEWAKNPVTSDGREASPIVYDAACLEEVCGSCAMLVNGVSRQGCTALVDQLEQPIVLEPMSKFPVVRDLAVDRSRMFEALKQIKGWIPIDGTHDLGPGPRMAEAEREWAYTLSKCMTCGNCLEVCPQINDRSDFIGAAAISQVRLFNAHPTGAMNAHERLEAIMGAGGVNDCGNAQNCVAACPKSIPLTTSIAAMYRATTVQALKDLFGK